MQHLILLLKRLGILLLLFSLCRLLFYIFNLSFFSDQGLGEVLVAFLHGVRFDLVAIAYLSLPLVLFYVIKLFFGRLNLNWLNKVVFLLLVVLVLLSNFADIVYFKFTLKRSTADVFHLVSMGGDFKRILPQLLKDYWYLFVLLLILSWVTIKWFDKIKPNLSEVKRLNLVKVSAFTMVLFVFLFLSARGGLQLRPIGILNAGFYNSPAMVPLVLNSPFSIINTLGKENLNKLSFYDDENEIEYSPFHSGSLTIDSNEVNTNVVIIVMESFSSEYSGYFNQNNISYTPFLDSVARHSLSFTRCYANGKKSIEGIPAITAAIPTLMNTPYSTSKYSGNRISGIASLLGNLGYSSSFYHGGTNGTMGFDSFSKVAGFQKYYGRNEYNNNEHFDGKWGIYDEEFFQYFANRLSATAEPFVSCFMSLSSHHPYLIPDKYKNVFSGGELEIHKSIQYADYSLGKFFKTASRSDWYSNTLFIITADHTGRAGQPYYKNRVGMYSIPLLFYMPESDLVGKVDDPTQQLDILTSVLDYLNVDFPHIGFGESVFDKDRVGFSINYINGLYELIKGDYALQFDGENSTAMYNVVNDSLLRMNLLDSVKEKRVEMEIFIKGFLQKYNSRMLENRLIIREKVN